MNVTQLIKELNSKAKYFSELLWGLEFDGKVLINNRLRSTYAQFIEYENKIEVNKIFLNNLNKYFIDEVLIHELCHWYCYKIKVDNDDGDLEFEKEIFKSGSRSTETTYVDEDNEVWLCDEEQWFYCEKCHKNNYEAIKINRSERINYYGVNAEKVKPKCPICGKTLTYYCEANCENEWVKYYPRQKLIDIVNEFMKNVS